MEIDLQEYGRIITNLKPQISNDDKFIRYLPKTADDKQSSTLWNTIFNDDKACLRA